MINYSLNSYRWTFIWMNSMALTLEIIITYSSLHWLNNNIILIEQMRQNEDSLYAYVNWQIYVSNFKLFKTWLLFNLKIQIVRQFSILHLWELDTLQKDNLSIIFLVISGVIEILQTLHHQTPYHLLNPASVPAAQT